MQLADPAAPLRAAHDARGAAGMQSGMRGGFESIFVSGIAEQGDNLHLEVIEISRTAGACPLLRQGTAGDQAGEPRGLDDLVAIERETDTGQSGNATGTERVCQLG